AVPVAPRILATLSVLGQRGLPPRDTRLLLLKVVGSSPALRASPETDRPCSAASASIAAQMLRCVNMTVVVLAMTHGHAFVHKKIPSSGHPKKGGCTNMTREMRRLAGPFGRALRP